ncbi:MAG: ATP-binding cassette domain-containing protein [Planctomycetota bacterium]
MPLLAFDCALRYSPAFELRAAFELDSGVTGLVGPSGAGKSTILHLIGGVLRADSGRIVLGDRVLTDTAARVQLPPERRGIGIVFQDHLLFPHRSVAANLRYGQRRKPAAAAAPAFADVVEVLGLGDLLERYPASLSGGERQRVALGRAILSGPALLLLDEPLAALDDELKERILDYLARALAGFRLPTLLVSHNRREIDRLAGRVVMVSGGQIAGTNGANGTNSANRSEPRPKGSGDMQ